MPLAKGYVESNDAYSRSPSAAGLSIFEALIHFTDGASQAGCGNRDSQVRPFAIINLLPENKGVP